MTVEELLKPRYKVIADYPYSDCTVDRTFVEGELEKTFFNNLAKYPHIFKPLQWWEDRKIEDLPRYFKAKNGKVFKAIEIALDPNNNTLWFTYNDGKYKARKVKNYLPSNETEYEQSKTNP